MTQIIVAIINQKGGVGKTTTSINLACGIAMLGRKVLLVDLDPQSHSTIVLGSRPDSCSATIQDVLLKGVAVRDIIVSTGIDNLYLAPSSIHLDKAEQLLIPEMFRETRLSNALSGLDYDYIVIDCRPTLGILSVNALYASNIVLIPCETARFSLEGFSDLLNAINLMKMSNQTTSERILRILFCKFDSRKAISNQWVMKQLEPHRTMLFMTHIRQCEALNQAHMAKESIFTFKPNSHGAEDYASLVKEFLS
jgi:chromosome partitioning protein